MKPFDRVTIAGAGLIGASLGMGLRARGLAREVVGFGRQQANLETAQAKGAVDRWSTDGQEAARGADLLVLATPVAALVPVAEALAPHLAPHAIVIDAGSVKGSVVSAMQAIDLGAERTFIGCHPIAGTESSGAAAAFAELFEGAWCVLTPDADADAGAVERIRALWSAVGMRVETMTPQKHDRLFAAVSHLPHAVAFALIESVVAFGQGGADPIAYSGGGLRDTTRIAASDPVMWRDIFLANRNETLRALDAFETELARLRHQIEERDGAGLETTIERARRARRRLS